MIKETLIKTLNELFELQRLESFMIGGLYLDDEALEILRPMLEPDNPNIGALGRYRGYPVHPMSEFKTTQYTRLYNRIGFEFRKMLAVD